MSIVCICGSTRFPQAHELAELHETLLGNVVIPLAMYGHADQPEGAKFLTSDGDENTVEKQRIDGIHFKKIDIADEILVINVAGYVGSSTKREIAHANAQGKPVRWLFESAAPADLAAWLEEA